MDYYQNLRSDMIRKTMYPVDHRRDYIPKREENSKVRIEPKAPCVPSFVSPIEGNAVEEGARIFFEGIVSSQPHPKFKWYFEDELIEPGKPGWEEAEIHHSRKMSTLIIRYTREYHMGRFSLLAQNELGYDVCSCDLIVRKKQFPPVFWKRLINTSLAGGQRYVMEVEVGGWPIPDVYWYKNDQMITPRIVTENYNHLFNAYVPEKKIEMVQIDQIRHAIIISRLSSSDSGKYTVYAKNAIGEAVCEADIEIEESEDSYTNEELFLPKLWRTGKRLTWKDEDERAKKFVGSQDPELSEEDIRDMTKRVSGTPLPRALEYLASLPDYKPDRNALKNVLPMTFKPEPPSKSSSSSKGSKDPPYQVRKPSKFTPGKITHRGYKCDAGEKVYPIWRSSQAQAKRKELRYNNVKCPSNVGNKEPSKRYPKDIKDPPCPHVWESHDTIDELYRILGAMRERDRSESAVPPYSKKKLDKKASSKKRPTPPPPPPMDQVDSPRTSRKKVHFVEGSSEDSWGQLLDQNVPGAQSDAEKFTKEFIKELSGSVAPGAPKSQIPRAEHKVGTHSNYLSQARNASVSVRGSEVDKRIHERGRSASQAHHLSNSASHNEAERRNHDGRSIPQARNVVLSAATSMNGGEADRRVQEERNTSQAHSTVVTTSQRGSDMNIRDHDKRNNALSSQYVFDESAQTSSIRSQFKTEISQIVQGQVVSQQEQQDKHEYHEYVPLRHKSQERIGSDAPEFIPVREKAKMIAQQTEAIVKKEEKQMRAGSESEAFVPGGVRILPPSPITVRSNQMEEEIHTTTYSERRSEMFSSSSQVQITKESFLNNEEDSSLAQDESTLDISRHSYAGTETSEAQYSDTSKESMIIHPDEDILPSHPLSKSTSFTKSGSIQQTSTRGTASAPSTPQNSRRNRTSPSIKEETPASPLNYRTPPSSPFIPSFYKPPPREDPAYSGSIRPVFRQIKKFTKKRRPRDTSRLSDSEN